MSGIVREFHIVWRVVTLDITVLLPMQALEAVEQAQSVSWPANIKGDLN